MPSDFLTTAQVAEKLTTTTDQVVALIHAGELDGVDISTGKKPRWRVSATSVDAFLERRRFRKAPPPTRARRRKVKATVDYFPNIAGGKR